MPTFKPNDLLEANVSKVFDKLGVHTEEKDTQVFHCLKDDEKGIVKLSNRKESLQILGLKEGFRFSNLTELHFPEGTSIFINESPCGYYCILRRKYRKLKTVGKLNVSFVLNGTTVNDTWRVYVCLIRF